MKMTYGRKFWACLIGLLLISLAYFTTLFMLKTIATSVTILYMVLVVTMVAIYIGGNVWNAWVNSKFFRSELKEESSE